MGKICALGLKFAADNIDLSLTHAEDNFGSMSAPSWMRASQQRGLASCQQLWSTLSFVIGTASAASCPPGARYIPSATWFSMKAFSNVGGFSRWRDWNRTCDSCCTGTRSIHGPDAETATSGTALITSRLSIGASLSRSRLMNGGKITKDFPYSLHRLTLLGGDFIDRDSIIRYSGGGASGGTMRGGSPVPICHMERRSPKHLSG